MATLIAKQPLTFISTSVLCQVKVVDPDDLLDLLTRRGFTGLSKDRESRPGHL